MNEGDVGPQLAPGAHPGAGGGPLAPRLVLAALRGALLRGRLLRGLLGHLLLRCLSHVNSLSLRFDVRISSNFVMMSNQP